MANEVIIHDCYLWWAKLTGSHLLDYDDRDTPEDSDAATRHTYMTSRKLDTSHEINEALRSQFESTGMTKSSMVHSAGSGSQVRCQCRFSADGIVEAQHCQCVDGNSSTSHNDVSASEKSLSVHVRVERVMMVEPNTEMLYRENYRRPRVAWVDYAKRWEVIIPNKNCCLLSFPLYM